MRRATLGEARRDSQRDEAHRETQKERHMRRATDGEAYEERHKGRSTCGEPRRERRYLSHASEGSSGRSDFLYSLYKTLLYVTRDVGHI